MWIDPCAIPVARLYRMNGAALLMSRTLSSFGSAETEPSPSMIEASICLGKVSPVSNYARAAPATFKLAAIRMTFVPDAERHRDTRDALSR